MCEALWTGAEKVDRCNKVNILPRGGRAAGKGGHCRHFVSHNRRHVGFLSSFCDGKVVLI